MLDNLRRAIKLEVKLSYRFPVIEGSLAVIIFACGVGTTSVFSRGIGMNVNPAFGYNSTEAVELYLLLIENAATAAFATALLNCTSILVLLVPIFVGFMLSKPYEDGTLRTLTSYPIGRRLFLASKIVLTIFFYGFLSVLISHIWIMVLFPGAINIVHILWLTIAFLLFIFFLSATLILIAVLSKHVAVTAVLGIFLWYATTIIVNMSSIPVFVLGVMNPTKAVFEYIIGSIGPEAFGDVASALVAVLAASVTLSFASLRVFNRAEI